MHALTVVRCTAHVAPRATRRAKLERSLTRHRGGPIDHGARRDSLSHDYREKRERRVRDVPTFAAGRHLQRLTAPARLSSLVTLSPIAARLRSPTTATVLGGPRLFLSLSLRAARFAATPFLSLVFARTTFSHSLILVIRAVVSLSLARVSFLWRNEVQ